MAWVTEWAPERVELDQCVDCGLCLPACPTFRLTGDEAASPRGRLTAMRAVASGQAEVEERFAGMMDMCLQCRACEAVCPSMVPFGRAMEGARAEVVAQLPTPAGAGRRYLFGKAIAQPRLVGAASSLLGVAQRLGLTRSLPGAARRASGIRELPLRAPATPGTTWEPQGEPVGTVALFSGCVMDPWFSGVHIALIQVLRTAGYRVEAPQDQVCCGALAAHEGAAFDAARLAERNVVAFSEFETVVVDAAGCGAHLKGYGHQSSDGAALAARVMDATELVAGLIEAGELPRLEPRGEAVAVQDPCHLRHAQGITAEPRAVVEAAGYDAVDIDAQALCCGAAGAYMLDHPEVSDELGRRKADQIRATGLRLVASANPGCEMQLRSHLGDGYRVAHPVEIYWEAISATVG
jgi:glycolate oxidase iron-sulfur subunit